MSNIIRPHKYIKYDGRHGAEIFCEFCGLVVHTERTMANQNAVIEQSRKGCSTSNLLTPAEQIEIAKLGIKDENIAE